MTEIIEAEVVEVVGQELEVHAPSPTLFRTDDPAEIIRRATGIATELGKVIDARGLFKVIGQKKHLLVEAWTLCGSMLGVFPVCVWTRETDDGWEARVEAHTITGAVVGAAEATCSRKENTWKSRDSYALRSMAQTRATSKALRMPLGFVAVLAGYDATPADEIPGGRRPSADPGESPETVDKKKLKEVLAKLGKAEEREDWTAVAKAFCVTHFSKDSVAKLTKNEMRSLIEELDRLLVQALAEDGPV